jgi:hypothetical protein
MLSGKVTVVVLLLGTHLRVSQLSIVLKNKYDDHLMKKKVLLCFIVLEVSVHWQLAPPFLSL